MVNDATNKPMSEVANMSDLDLYATARLRERFYQELYDD